MRSPAEGVRLSEMTDTGAKAARLAQHAAPPGDVERSVKLLSAPFPGYPQALAVAALSKTSDASLAAALFPATPCRDELNWRSSKFVQRWLLAEADLLLPAPTDLAQSAW